MDILTHIINFEHVHGIEVFVNCVDDFILNNGQEFLNLIQDMHYDFQNGGNTLLIQFRSSYYSARIVGKQGSVIKQIQKITDTNIASPSCWAKTRSSFIINGDKFNNVDHARAIICFIGLFFFKKFQNNITPKAGEVQECLQVQPKHLSFLLANQGYLIKCIQNIYAVRIVSPKPYSSPCFFYFIGKMDRVKCAKHALEQCIFFRILSNQAIKRS